MSSDEENFLSRWSRRKRSEADATPGGDIVKTAPPETDNPAEVETRENEAELLRRLGLPDPDTLAAGDDFAAFMISAVPASIRRRALRRLWRSNPVLANLDGLNDYDGDFTGGALPSNTIETLYKVGRGFLSSEAGENDAIITADQSVSNRAVDAKDASAGPDQAKQNVAKIPEPVPLTDKAQDFAGAATRRWMTFTFPDQ